MACMVCWGGFIFDVAATGGPGSSGQSLQPVSDRLLGTEEGDDGQTGHAAEGIGLPVGHG